MRHLRFWINCLLLLIPICFLSIGAYRRVQGVFAYLNSNKRLAGAVSTEATRLLGREVRVDDVHVSGNLWSLDSSNTVDLFDVFVAASGTNARSPFARAKRVTVAYNLRQALFPTDPTVPYIDDLRLDAPQVWVARDAEGHWNFEDFPHARKQGGRTFTPRLTFRHGVIALNDQDFPAPHGVAHRPFLTQVQNVAGQVDLHPDKSASFHVTGDTDPNIAHDFHATGILNVKPLNFSARVQMTALRLPFLAARFVDPSSARLTSGSVNLELTSHYATPEPSAKAAFSWQGLAASGSVQIQGATLVTPNLGAPLQNVNGTFTFTDSALVGGLQAQFEGMPVQVNGSALSPERWTAYFSGISPAPDWRALVVNAQGQFKNADFGQIER